MVDWIFDAADHTSGASTDGQVLTSDGSGGAAWETPTGMVLLGTATLGADATSISVSSISGSYSHLLVVIHARTDRVNLDDWIGIQFNDDTGNNYDYNFIKTTGTSVSGGVARSGGQGSGGMCETANSSANVFSNHVIRIPFYSHASHTKTAVVHSGRRSDASADSDIVNELTHNWWSGTAAITKIKVVPWFGTNLKAGTRIDVYGV